MSKKSQWRKWPLFGATASTIAIPALLVVSCGETIKAKTTSAANVAFVDANGTPIKIGQLVAEQKNQENTPVQTNLLNGVKELAAETLYDDEQKASIERQSEWFQWDIYDKTVSQWKSAGEIVAQYPTTPGRPTLSTDPDQKVIGSDPDTKQSEIIKVTTWFDGLSDAQKKPSQSKRTTIKSLQEEIDGVQKKIDAITNKTPDYNASSFASNYPKIITPLAKIKDSQTKTYNEAKDGFIATYPTKAEGQVAWETERPKRYNNAKSDAEAITTLISNAISTVAFGRYTYAIDSSFTVRQVKSGVFKQFKVDGNGKYIFDGSLHYYTKLDGTNKPDSDDGKVYFLGKSTMLANEMVVDMADQTNQDALDLFAQKEVVEVQHTLIDTKSGTASTLPWTVTKDTMKNMLARYSDGTGASQNVFDLYKGMFTNNTPDQNTQFLKFWSNNEDTTKDKQGILGVNTMSYWIGQMDYGFGLGVAAAQAIKNNITSNKADVGYAADNNGNEAGKQILDDIQTKLQATLPANVTSPTDVGKYNKAMTDYVDSLLDDQFNKTFGAIYRDAFVDPNNASNNQNQLVYPVDASKNVYLVRSSFGIHLIKITELQDAQSIQAILDSDLHNIADKDDVNAAAVDWGTVFKSVFTDEEIVKNLLSNTVIENAHHFDDITAFQATHPNEYKEWKDAQHIDGNSSIKTAALAIIANIQHNDNINTAVSALNGKSDSVIKDIDGEFLSSAIKPEAIYNAALEEMGATK